MAPSAELSTVDPRLFARDLTPPKLHREAPTLAPPACRGPCQVLVLAPFAPRAGRTSPRAHSRPSSSGGRTQPGRSSTRRAARRRGAKAGAKVRTRTSTALRQQALEDQQDRGILRQILDCRGPLSFTSAVPGPLWTHVPDFLAGSCTARLAFAAANLGLPKHEQRAGASCRGRLTLLPSWSHPSGGVE
jgi:hypothetical protein